MMAKGSTADMIACVNAKLMRQPACHLDNVSNRLVHSNHIQRLWLGVFSNTHDSAILTHKDHIERNYSVFHPHLHFLRRVKIKQHGVVWRNRLAEHQALFLSGLRNRDLSEK